MCVYCVRAPELNGLWQDSIAIEGADVDVRISTVDKRIAV